MDWFVCCPGLEFDSNFRKIVQNISLILFAAYVIQKVLALVLFLWKHFGLPINYLNLKTKEHNSYLWIDSEGLIWFIAWY